jgi:isoleucyl-tRNA synthetase
VLWNVYAFFVTYARLVGWTPDADVAAVAERPILDRWILSQAARTAETVEDRLNDVDALGATRALSAYLDGLSTWYLRLSRRRFSRSGDAADQRAAFATLHEALVSTARMLAPILPFLSDSMYGNLVTTIDPAAPDSVHLTRWPSADLAARRDEALEARMAIAQGAVELARTLRSTAHIRTRQPLATAWLALPDRDLAFDRELLRLIADEINVKAVEVIDDESNLVERRVKPLLPIIGKRLGAAIPAVMAAARSGDVTFEADGSVTLGGVTLAPDEVEIQATPRPGTAVAHHDGLVVVLDTTLTPELVEEGDARELARAIQDLRRDAQLALDDRIDLWVDPVADGLSKHLPGVVADTLAVLAAGAPPADAQTAAVELDAGRVTIALRRRSDGPDGAAG